ncbi:GNAT family N-acetyltransferase [Amycolatopsis palatopharyngis]|uniref:GNAT family N-acetyltransferase n=1 Tax=Amycolatopsis palatopharyngis TaxID=187982 RepID=UPI000E22ED31|nr:GNAT family N-acetyltransferase [Amycolatopsis palatopharyngis]
MDPKVVEDPAARRFQIYADDELAGFVEYHLYADEIAFLHTEIDSRFEGRGLGGKLARHALDDARAKGRSVLPYCPFIRGWISKHPDYIDLVPADKRDRFDL